MNQYIARGHNNNTKIIWLKHTSKMSSLFLIPLSETWEVSQLPIGLPIMIQFQIVEEQYMTLYSCQSKLKSTQSLLINGNRPQDGLKLVWNLLEQVRWWASSSGSPQLPPLHGQAIWRWAPHSPEHRDLLQPLYATAHKMVMINASWVMHFHKEKIRKKTGKKS